MRHLLVWMVTAFGILSAAVLAWGPQQPAPRAATPRLGSPARAQEAPGRTAQDVPPPAGAPATRPDAAAGGPPAHAARPQRPARPAAPHPEPLPAIDARTLLGRTLNALQSPPAFRGILAERVGSALPAVQAVVGADGSLMAPGRRILSIRHDPPDLWRIADRAIPQPPGTDTPPGLGGLDALLSRLKQGAGLSVAGQGRVDGLTVYRLHAVQRDGGLAVGAVDLWIDGRTYLPLRIEATGPAGIPLVSAGFTHIAFADSPAARFRFVPPPGARRAGAAAAGGSASPATKP